MKTTAHAGNAYNESAYRASWSRDGSLEKSEKGEPHLFLSAAIAEAQRKTKGNRAVEDAATEEAKP